MTLWLLLTLACGDKGGPVDTGGADSGRTDDDADGDADTDTDTDTDTGGDTDTDTSPDTDTDTDTDTGPMAWRGDGALAELPVIIRGDQPGGLAGRAVDGTGDVDGDGVGDLILAAPMAPGAGDEAEAGRVYLLQGPLAGTRTVADADRTFYGPRAEAWLGWSVAGLGDLDGDGQPEVGIGAPLADGAAPQAGAAWVFSDIAAADGLDDAERVIHGAATRDQLGIELCTAGDQDGDGWPDLLVGAWLSDDPARDAGAVAVFGGAATGTLTLGDAGFLAKGLSENDWAGYAACGGGDVDGDGADDLFIGADGSDLSRPEGGAAFVFHGPVLPDAGARRTDLSAADASILAEGNGDFAGHTVAIVGDQDGDGHADLFTGALGYRAEGVRVGRAYLFTGDPGPGASAGAADRIWTGTDENGMLGYTVQGAGDLDRDGIEDLLLGIRYAADAGVEAGAVQLLYGDRTLSYDDGWYGIAEAAGDEATYALGAGGDVNGDGWPDAFVGAPGWGDDDVGAVYVITGGRR
ncbi:MAG: FG-GAP repeat protein [Alphaproteobacteria bacterium]|nr:FG-GAP repeat protein [Alphaproteobacteria bacterium]